METTCKKKKSSTIAGQSFLARKMAKSFSTMRRGAARECSRVPHREVSSVVRIIEGSASIPPQFLSLFTA